MTKKKLIVRMLIKHSKTPAYLSGEWYMVMATCVCGWEKECADQAQADKEHAKHAYSMIKKALKKRRRILSL